MFLILVTFLPFMLFYFVDFFKIIKPLAKYSSKNYLDDTEHHTTELLMWTNFNVFLITHDIV